MVDCAVMAPGKDDSTDTDNLIQKLNLIRNLKIRQYIVNNASPIDRHTISATVLSKLRLVWGALNVSQQLQALLWVFQPK
ncbi:hypothetical protein PHISP_02524 [Aspergillus sp. HF37]|nr:hypothetical protein PHISP_02524 [Aspergillus sp. HF37]